MFCSFFQTPCGPRYGLCRPETKWKTALFGGSPIPYFETLASCFDWFEIYPMFDESPTGWRCSNFCSELRSIGSFLLSGCFQLLRIPDSFVGLKFELILDWFWRHFNAHQVAAFPTSQLRR